MSRLHSLCPKNFEIPLNYFIEVLTIKNRAVIEFGLINSHRDDTFNI